MSSKVLISLTSIPRRFDSTLREVILSLNNQTLEADILVNIPPSYKKWPNFEILHYLYNIPRVTVFRPTKDFGPATKLLGALEYLNKSTSIKKIITVDDDVVFEHPTHLEYLVKHHNAAPNSVITINGIRLIHEPYRFKNGLKYNCQFRRVEIPAGFKGVVYPAKRLQQICDLFSLQADFPEAIFNDDDTYFGIVMGKHNIPVIAIPHEPALTLRFLDDKSAVEEGTVDVRADNDMRNVQFAVREKYFLNGTRSHLNIIELMQLGLTYLHFIVAHYTKKLLYKFISDRSALEKG